MIIWVIIVIIWPVRPCERFLCKTIDGSPVWGPYAFAQAGPEKSRTALLQKRTASRVKTLRNFVFKLLIW